MPIKMERALKKEARKKGLTGDRFGAYVYGTIHKLMKDHKKSGNKKKY